MGVGKNFVPISVTLVAKVTKLPMRDEFYLVPTTKWEPLTQLLQNLVSISPLSCFPPDLTLEKFCWIFFVKFRMRFWEWDFKVKSRICYISAKNGSTATKQKANISIER